MIFILQMARREIRTSWKRLLFFFLCIGIGVGSIVALRSVIHNLNDALAAEARTLLAADVQIDSTRPWLAETLAAIDRVGQAPLVTGAPRPSNRRPWRPGRRRARRGADGRAQRH
ncbi:MAG: hypothetical protein WKF30_18290 [Pyrinomonadaceae bacterium]